MQRNIRTRGGGRLDHPLRDGGRGLPRHRDADHGQADARGRARLPRADAPAARPFLRAAAEPADLQAAARDLGIRALLPDRPLLPGRGSPRRPAAGDHAARRRDGLPRPGVPVRADGADHVPDLARAPRRRARIAVPAAHLGGGRPALRLRQARSPLRARDRGGDRGHARLRVQGVRRRRRRCGSCGFRSELSRGDLAKLEEVAKQWGAKGLAYLVYGADGEVRSPIAKFLGEAELARVPERAGPHGRVRRRRAGDGLARARRASPASRPRARADRPLGAEVPLGDGLPDVRVGSGGARAGTPSITRSRGRTPRARRFSTPIRARRRRSPTTSSRTGSRSPAARSGSTSPSCRRRCSAC